MTKICTKCAIPKEEDEFPYHRKSLGIRHAVCKKCHSRLNSIQHKRRTDDPVLNAARRKAQKETRIKKKEFIDSLKRNKPCVDCGKVYPPCAMDFDHVFGTKKFSIGSMGMNLSSATILEETAKCVIRCANCHRIKTHGCEV